MRVRILLAQIPMRLIQIMAMIVLERMKPSFNDGPKSSYDNSRGTCGHLNGSNNDSKSDSDP